MNRKVRFNDGWEFAKSKLGLEKPVGLTFESVDIPHDWLIYNTLDLYEDSIGWYRKKLVITEQDQAREVLLAFDGVYMDSSLYVNGQWIGDWKYGYSSFEHNITKALAIGENEILLKVVHQAPNSRWYSGAGIYRNVWLKTRGASYIETDGIYVTTSHHERDWQVEIETELKLDREAVLQHTLYYQGEAVQSCSERVAVDPQGTGNCVSRQRMTVTDPYLWDINTPHLYKLVTELRLNLPEAGSLGDEAIVESVTQSVGFRDIVLDPAQGFFLNGKSMKLNGVCEHHDFGALGAAFYLEALRRRFRILRDMGVNAIRTAHNMPAPELMDLADEMGLLVVSEAFDMWERPKTTYDYARFFKEWAAVDVKSWVRRDRNHPSLLMWSIGNEIYDTHADERGQEITRMLMAEVLKHDPQQHARVTIGSNFMPWENAQKCADIVKLAGYNYGEKYYEQHHAEHPDWIIYGSETASVVQSRGIYHFPLEQPILSDDDGQCSALGNSSTSWGAKSAEACIINDRDAPFSLGQFIWTGFDYIGEPTPYHTKNSYFGQLDTATFPKDPYYIYQAEWTSYKDRPMVYLFPYWDFNPGQIIDVRVCSNAPSVELFCNGVSVGTHEIDHRHGRQLVGSWKLPYQEGELKAVAYDEDGRIIATEVRHSFKDACRIRLQADKSTMLANGRDLIFVEIQMEDEDGRLVENANNRVTVEVSGAGRLVGLDNGDSTDYDPYKGTSRRLFSGKLMAIVAAGMSPGKVYLKVSSNGMDSRTMEFEACPAVPEEQEGLSAIMSNQELPIVMGSLDEIPLRKIELVSRGGQQLNESRTQVQVEARLHPCNTSYKELEWSVVNDAGIPSNLARIEGEGLTATVTALGDGDFRVRCTSKNGSDKVKLISELEFQVTGLGTAGKDPYGFISGGLYDYSSGEIGNGNERGVSTSRDGESHVGFRQLDFGPHGSDEITIPIFALSSEPYPIEIWEGMPGEEGSERIAEVIYQKESKWNVYQEETFRLNKRLRGITSICFVLRAKVHIKGFTFTRQNRALEQNAAADCDHIYGDAFKVAGSCVEGIGNNVSLEFQQMDFGAEGVTRLILCGHSPIDKNTVHVRFAGPEGESRQELIEFTLTEGYVTREFTLPKVTGVQDVTFIFLPGSQFNFGWFKFER